ncbi:alpha/beta fold hydrolase [Streptomyces hygroscopicus]|uniref:alpha/beta fold hydrolase n=1 Tax=Streptomyces hygroscopicus TaxID=1912 RepID=UPI0033D338DE
MISVEESVRTVSRAEDTTIHHTADGPADGPTWGYIHGRGCRRRDFAPVATFLPTADRVISVDLPGHRDSTSAPTDWTMAEFAPDAAAVLDAESVARCVAAGHSMGGAVALELGSHHFLPEKPAGTAELPVAARRTA